jgi:hypothetical protein
VFSLSYWFWSFWLSPELRLIYFMRAANLGNGVSPIMPLIFLAFASRTQTGGRLWRLRILEERRFTLPFLNFDRGAESFRGTDRLEEDVVKTLECAPWNLAGWRPLLIFLIGIFSYYAMTGFNIHPLDRSVFDRFISFPMPSAFQLLAFVSGFFIYLFFATQLLRFVVVWGALRRLLQRRYWHPSRDTYSGLRPDKDGRVRLLESSSSLSMTEFCLEHGRKTLEILWQRFEACRFPALGAAAAQTANSIIQVEQCRKMTLEEEEQQEADEGPRCSIADSTLAGDTFRSNGRFHGARLEPQRLD